MKHTLARQSSNTLSTQSFVAHSHTHSDYTLHTYMQVRMGEKTTLANDVHQIASKVWTRVWTTHLSSHTSLFSSPFNYIFIFVVAEWCVEPRSATDPSRDPTEIEHPPYPTITPPSFPPPSPSILPWGLCKYFSCDFTPLSWSGSAFSPSILLATRWQAENG